MQLRSVLVISNNNNISLSMIPLFLLVLVAYIPNKMNGNMVEFWGQYTGPNRCCKLTGYQTAL